MRRRAKKSGPTFRSPRRPSSPTAASTIGRAPTAATGDCCLPPITRCARLMRARGNGSAPGDLRAFDVRTGQLVWTFHTIPRPGEFGYDTWPKDAWKTVGGANVWGELPLDEKRGIVYAPTGSAKYNFYGGNRHGANLFGDCLL